jgi:4-hydroxy-4-methyl-2-oxoglutarate aldolase
MDISRFAKLSPVTFGDVLPRHRFMDIGMRPLWEPIPRIAGPAYTVACPPGDNLMLHAAIHRAPPGSIIVVQGGDRDYALAGGNVCATAQKRGVAGFVLDGVIRDIAETRDNRFPVFGRGVIPIPGDKKGPGTLEEPVTCGGVHVAPGDIVVADEEGIVVIEAAKAESVLAAAEAKAAKDATETLDSWMRTHKTKIDEAMKKLGR